MKNVAKENLPFLLINERITENEVYFIQNTQKEKFVAFVKSL